MDIPHRMEKTTLWLSKEPLSDRWNRVEALAVAGPEQIGIVGCVAISGLPSFQSSSSALDTLPPPSFL